MGVHIDSIAFVARLFFTTLDGTQVPEDVEIGMVTAIKTIILGTRHLGGKLIISQNTTRIPLLTRSKVKTSAAIRGRNLMLPGTSTPTPFPLDSLEILTGGANFQSRLLPLLQQTQQYQRGWPSLMINFQKSALMA